MKHLENLATASQDVLKMFKKSPQKEGYLKEIEEKESCDTLHEIPSHAGLLIEWCRTRWTENKKALQGIKNNLPCMKIGCDYFSKPSVTGDAMQRDRSIGHSHNLSSFSHIYSLLMCME